MQEINYYLTCNIKETENVLIIFFSCKIISTKVNGLPNNTVVPVDFIFIHLDQGSITLVPLVLFPVVAYVVCYTEPYTRHNQRNLPCQNE